MKKERPTDRTSLTVNLDTLLHLHELKLELSRLEHRVVPLDEVLTYAATAALTVLRAVSNGGDDV